MTTADDYDEFLEFQSDLEILETQVSELVSSCHSSIRHRALSPPFPLTSSPDPPSC
jgi:hypothetical protein